VDNLRGILEVIELAQEYSLETRVRRLLREHADAGTPGKTLVMNAATAEAFRDELLNQTEWRQPLDDVHLYRGLFVLLKEEIPDGEIVVGV
jgi:hypothetical protein